MIRSLACSALGGALLLGSGAPAAATDYTDQALVNSGQVTISCYRGPWDDVIWDRPNPAFLDSLVRVGYSYGDALAIGDRVCRDPSTVDQPARAVQLMQQIIAQNPPH